MGSLNTTDLIVLDSLFLSNNPEAITSVGTPHIDINLKKRSGKNSQTEGREEHTSEPLAVGVIEQWQALACDVCTTFPCLYVS
jgi:hypothetical protein